jgi:hypothetical protein
MKRILILSIGLIMLCATTFAAGPPAAVSKSFDKKYPKALKVGWSSETTKNWEAAFMLEGVKVIADFAEDGTWLDSHRPVNIIDLPKSVAESMKKGCEGWVGETAMKYESANLGTSYEVHIRKGMDHKAVTFKEDGTMISE